MPKAVGRPFSSICPFFLLGVACISFSCLSEHPFCTVEITFALKFDGREIHNILVLCSGLYLFMVIDAGHIFACFSIKNH